MKTATTPRRRARQPCRAILTPVLENALRLFICLSPTAVDELPLHNLTIRYRNTLTAMRPTFENGLRIGLAL